MNYYTDFYHFGKIIGEYQFATSSCYSKKEVNEMDKVIYLNIEQILLNSVIEKIDFNKNRGDIYENIK